MIFAFAEDGTLAVLEDIVAVRRHCEALDVESRVYVFYAADGTWLRPRFVRPNKRGMFGSRIQGEYELEPEPAPPEDVDPFAVALDEAVALEPNAVFASLEALRAFFAARRSQS
ncbi:MAG: hypothetical protein ACREO3_01555 [Arenimonas sp.]